MIASATIHEVNKRKVSSIEIPVDGNIPHIEAIRILAVLKGAAIAAPTSVLFGNANIVLPLNNVVYADFPIMGKELNGNLATNNSIKDWLPINRDAIQNGKIKVMFLNNGIVPADRILNLYIIIK